MNRKRTSRHYPIPKVTRFNLMLGFLLIILFGSGGLLIANPTEQTISESTSNGTAFLSVLFFLLAVLIIIWMIWGLLHYLWQGGQRAEGGRKQKRQKRAKRKAAPKAQPKQVPLGKRERRLPYPDTVRKRGRKAKGPAHLDKRRAPHPHQRGKSKGKR